MSERVTDRDALVVVHRWFDRGAGWAYAPQVGESILAIMSALDTQLKAGKPDKFHVRMDNDRYLVGMIANDPECADPKARERKPTILRAVLVDRQPSPMQEQLLLERLAGVWPTQPGPDPGLMIDVLDSLCWPSETSASREEVANKPMKMILITLAFLSVCAILLSIFFLPWTSTSDNTPKAELQSVIQTMIHQLSSWGVQITDKPPDAVVTVYCKYLSQEELGVAIHESKHPYHRFVSRLPRLSEKQKNDIWTEQNLAVVLRAIVAMLDPDSRPPQEIAAIDSLSRIDELMSYERWRKSAIMNDPEGAFAEEPNDVIARYVERFRKRSGSIGGIVPGMRVCLQQWNVKEAEVVPDFTVLRLFFQTLKRPSERMEGLTDADMRHAYWKFMSRLPAVSCSAWTGDSDKEVEEGIGKVVVALGKKTENQPVANWIDIIRDEMNYDSWLEKQDEKKMIKNGEPDCIILRSLVDRFRSQKK